MQGQLSPPHIDRWIAALAERQHGVVARHQLVAAGLTEGALDHRLASGRLHRVHTGVYAVGHTVLTRRGRYMAAVLACGPTAALSHRSAADLLGIRQHAGRAIHVSVTTRSDLARPGIAVHRPRTLLADEVTEVDGIPVTTPARTLLDLAEVVNARLLTRACDATERARLVDWAEVLAAIDRHPHKVGAKRLRKVLALNGVGEDRSRSDLEDALLVFCARYGFPAPEQNIPVLGQEVDFCWPDLRLIAETDGWEFHGTRLAFEADRRRDCALVAAGWRVIRITFARLTHDAPGLARELRQLMRPG